MITKKSGILYLFVLLLIIDTLTTDAQERAVARAVAPTQKQSETLDTSLLREKIRLIQIDAQHSPSQPVPLSNCARTPTDLIAWFPLDEAQSPPVTDVVTGAAAQRPNGPTTVVGKVSGALQFDGRDDFVEIAASSASRFNLGTQNLSFDAWVRLRPTDSSTGVRVLVEKRQQSPLRGYSFYLSNARPGIQLADASGFTNYGASFSIPRDGNWHLIAVTVDRSRSTGGIFYLDGTPTGVPFNASNRQGNLDNAAPLRIGSTTLTASPQSLFIGGIDELEIVARALTGEEITNIAIAGSTGKCTIAAIKIHLACEGKKADFDVTGYLSAKKAIDWVEANCSGSVTVSW